jgi:hypothetical protein
MSDFRWDEASTEKLKALYAEGKSMSVIAAEIGGPSRNAVIGKLHRLIYAGKIKARPESMLAAGFSGKRPAPGLAHVPAIRARAEAGASDVAIAAELGIRAEDVRHVRRLEGIQSRVAELLQPTSEAVKRVDAIRRLVASGLNDAEIGARLGFTLGQVRHARRVSGVKGNVAAPALRKPAAAASAPQDHKLWFSEGYRGQTASVSLLELKDCMCRFPIDQAEGPVRYCGAAVVEGSPWCEGHHARCCNGIPTPKAALKPSHVYRPRAA